MSRPENILVRQPILHAYQQSTGTQHVPLSQFRSRFMQRHEIDNLTIRRFVEERCLSIPRLFDRLAYKIERCIYLSNSDNRYFHELRKKYSSAANLANVRENQVEQRVMQLIRRNIITEEELLEKGYVCPISNQVIQYPVVISENGRNYYFEKHCIYEWLGQKRTNPMTQQPVTRKQVKEDAEFAAQISHFLQKKEDVASCSELRRRLIIP